jgi:hypothetical protein
MMTRSDASHPLQTYAIRVGEYLDDDFAAWFSPLSVHHSSDCETTLLIHVRDQTELHGLLLKIRDFNLTLIEIVKVVA